MAQAMRPVGVSTSLSHHSQRPVTQVWRGFAFTSRSPRVTVGRRIEKESVVGASLSSSESDVESSTRVTAKGRMTYKPASFREIVSDATGAVLEAIKDGFTRLEVEFPPVPQQVDGYKGASDMYIDSNAQLAFAAAKLIAASGKRAHVVVPDYGEYARTYKMFKSALELMDGVSLGHLREASDGGLIGGIQMLMAGKAPPSAEAGSGADVYLVINASCVELPIVEQYCQSVAGSKPVVLWNMELDTLRGDLGLPAFPPKDVQHRFLCRFKPVYYLRPRDYSKSVNVAPFIVNYSGALFREYPGPWQVMLKQDSREYACIAEDRTRYNLGDVKEELMAAMGLNTEEEGSAMAFLRRGYKTSTWWEDDRDKDQAADWRE